MAKINWLDAFAFPYDEIHLVKYGTTKANCTRKLGGYQILVDDNKKVRDGWTLGATIDATTNIMDALESPMAGKVIEVKVKPGDAVADGDELIIIESMKMEIPIMADGDGTVSEVLVEPGKEVMAGDIMIKF